MKSSGCLRAGAASMSLAWAALTTGEVNFVNVGQTCNLIHENPYGSTFDSAATQCSRPAWMMHAMQAAMGNGVGVGDYDHDGDFDIYLTTQMGVPNTFYRNDIVAGQRVFTDVSIPLGLNDYGFGRHAQFVDLDNDGWQDLLLFNDDEPEAIHPTSKVFRNDHGAFVDVTANSGFDPIGYLRGGACVGDYDGDGLLDVYCGLWVFDAGSGCPGFPGYNRLFRNLGNFKFDDVTLDVGLGVLSRDSFSCVFADFDNDGDGDLYVAVDHTSDKYYRNDNGIFVDDSLAVGATHTGNDMGISVIDFDNDGDLDVYSTNITDADGIVGTTQYNTLLINQLMETQTLSFVDQAQMRGVHDTYWGWGTEFVDVDNDADLDLYAVNGFDEFLKGVSDGLVNTPEVLFINDGTGHFTRAVGCGADFVGDARAAVAFDFDLDGDQDFLVTSIYEETVLLDNRTTPKGRYLDVHLIGSCGFNANAVGARVYLTLAETTHMREVLGGGSYMAGRPFVQHFGLGSATKADSLRVVWPDGVESLFEDLPADHRVAIEYPLESSPARMTLSRGLRDFAAFQRCMGASQADPVEPGCVGFDADGSGIVEAADMPGFMRGFLWTLPGCAAPP